MREHARRPVANLISNHPVSMNDRSQATRDILQGHKMWACSKGRGDTFAFEIELRIPDSGVNAGGSETFQSMVSYLLGKKRGSVVSGSIARVIPSSRCQRRIKRHVLLVMCVLKHLVPPPRYGCDKFRITRKEIKCRLPNLTLLF